MTKKEFIDAMRRGLDELENNKHMWIDLPSGYIFGNINYGEVNMSLAKGVKFTVKLFEATDEEKTEAEEADTE